MLVIHCECGAVLRGRDSTEVLAVAREHLVSAHPQLVGQISDEQFLGMAEIVI